MDVSKHIEQIRHKYFEIPLNNRLMLDAGVLLILALLFCILYIISPPALFPEGRIIAVEVGSTLSEISGELKKEHVIRSELIFEAFLTLLAGDGGAKAGEYLFKEKLSSYGVAKKVAKGEFGLDPIKITIPEGATIFDIARILNRDLPDFDEIEFIDIAKGKEGYLFPDTYLFLPNASPEQIVLQMERTFINRIADIQDEIIASGKSIEEIVTMASILEKETITNEDKKIVSGILWKRIEIGMPLQVDATFLYINGKNSFDLTYDDLKIDSPYNTYKHKGLPVGPIANPGLESLAAAVTPTESTYLFYLSDQRSIIHYAENFEQHKINKAKYIP